MSRRKILLPLEVKAIKAMLWSGTPPAQIMQQFPHVKAPMLSAIKWGRIWTEIEWPNGDTGPMSEIQNRQLLVTANQTKVKSLVDHRKSPWGISTVDPKEDFRQLVIRYHTKRNEPIPTGEAFEEAWRHHQQLQRNAEEDLQARREQEHADYLKKAKANRIAYEKEHANDPPPLNESGDPLRGLRPFKQGKPNIPDLLKYPDDAIKQLAQQFPSYKEELLAVIQAKKKITADATKKIVKERRKS